MPDTTKVYFAYTNSLEDDALFSRLYHTVSPPRRRKIDGLLTPKNKRLSLGAALLLKKALADFGVHNPAIQHGQWGKPYILGREDICFNLSHSEEMVLCAVSPREVGCDVEKISDINLTVARRFFCAAEYDAIARKGSKEEQRELFFRMWTLKESFIKATGLGMNHPLDGFQIQIDDEIRIIQNMNRETYYFKEYELDSSYKCAVCSLVPDFDEAQQIAFI